MLLLLCGTFDAMADPALTGCFGVARKEQIVSATSTVQQIKASILQPLLPQHPAPIKLYLSHGNVTARNEKLDRMDVDATNLSTLTSGCRQPAAPAHFWLSRL